VSGHAVLRRKAGAARAGARQRPEVERAIGLALARAAQDMMSLPIELGQIEGGRATLVELLDMPEPLALFAMLEGPGESLGFVMVTAPALAALIESQTIGRVTAAEPVARRPTRTDAAMTAGLIDRLFAEVERSLGAAQDAAWVVGYRYASFLDDPRPLGLLLEDTTYRVCRLDLGFGAPVAKRGAILIALPATPRAGAAPRRQALAAASPASASDELLSLREPGQEAAEAAAAAALRWSRSLEAAVMATPATLDAVLERVSMPLAAVLTLRPGMLLPLPTAALERLALEGPGGRRLAEGRLGQTRGLRAVRLSLPEAPSSALAAE
jgi:flagellar motor switch protein FliM